MAEIPGSPAGSSAGTTRPKRGASAHPAQPLVERHEGIHAAAGIEAPHSSPADAAGEVGDGQGVLN
jgi:hypothetical protein